jgi:hypothetical protein
MQIEETPGTTWQNHLCHGRYVARPLSLLILQKKVEKK